MITRHAILACLVASASQSVHAAAATPPAAATVEATHTTKPNFVWLHVESTDGRTYQQDMKDLVPIPHIRSLMARGANFVNAYANVPICCPSRASTWAGREGHNMKHTRKDSGLVVNGAWNNNEGFGDEKGGGFDALKISDRLQRDGNYTIHISGKEDWLTGGHSLNTMIDSFSIYSRWPYNIPEEGGFHVWGDCGGNVTVNPGNETAHEGDWKTLRDETAWIRDVESGEGAVAQQPFFFYQGMVIVHPPYNTDEEHLARIPTDGVVAPQWPAFDDEKARGRRVVAEREREAGGKERERDVDTRSTFLCNGRCCALLCCL
jgi:arylsulfatase A-like enzyme